MKICLAKAFLLAAFWLGLTFGLEAQNLVLVDIDKGSRMALIDLENDQIGLELDSQLIEDYARSITSEGIVMASTSQFYSWKQIKSIAVQNRYQGKKGKRIYWSAVATGLFLAVATDLYVIQTDPYFFIPLSMFALFTAPVWGLVVPVILEVADGPGKRIVVEVEGQVKVEPYEQKVRYILSKNQKDE